MREKKNFLIKIMQQLKNLVGHGKEEGGATWFVTAERAEGLRDKDRFGKSDPYCKIKFGNKTHKTKHIKNDRSPTWRETFEFHTNANEIEVTIKDHDIGFDDEIGKCTITRNEFPSNGQSHLIKKPIEKGGQITGMVELKIQKQ